MGRPVGRASELDGRWPTLRGKVIGRRPLGERSPNRVSIRAGPASTPGCQAIRTASATSRISPRSKGLPVKYDHNKRFADGGDCTKNLALTSGQAQAGHRVCLAGSRRVFADEGYGDV